MNMPIINYCNLKKTGWFRIMKVLKTIDTFVPQQVTCLLFIFNAQHTLSHKTQWKQERILYRTSIQFINAT